MNRLRASMTAVLAALALILPACERQDQIGALFGQGGSGSSGGTSDDPGGTGAGGDASGVILLNDLFSGAQLDNGAPRVDRVIPDDESQNVSVVNPIVFMISESLAVADPDHPDPLHPTLPSVAGIGLSELQPNDMKAPVSGFGTVLSGTSRRVLVFQPDEPLKPGAQYEISLQAQFLFDLTGDGLTIPDDLTQGDDSGGGGGIFGGITDSTKFQFETSFFSPPASSQNLPPDFDVAGMFPLPDSRNNSRELPITLIFSEPVASGASTPGAITEPGAVIVTANDSPIAGTVSFIGGPGGDKRFVRFDPASLLPLGALITVRVSHLVRSAALGFPLDNSQDFVASFRVTSVPTPRVIGFPGNSTVTSHDENGAPKTYAGRITLANIEDFKTDVTVPSASPGAAQTTLLFFQNKNGIKVARGYTQERGAGTIRYKSDLALGTSAPFADTDSQEPPLPVVVGAFASRGSDNSPVGPVELPELYMKTSMPRIAFGPPAHENEPFVFRTTVAAPAICGSSSEPLLSFRAVTDAAEAQPLVFEAVALSGVSAVTDGARFFITEAPRNAITGVTEPGVPRFLPREISELRFSDFIGNSFKLKAPDAGEIRQEGSIGGTLGSDSNAMIRVRVVRAVDLIPIENAMVRIGPFPATSAEPGKQRVTNKDGEVGFKKADLAAFGTFLTATFEKNGFDVFTLAGFHNPAVPGNPSSDQRFGISVPLVKTGGTDVTLTVTTKKNIPPSQPGKSFTACAFGPGRPKTESTVFRDARFGSTQRSPSSNEVDLLVEKNRPQIVSAIEFDGGDAYGIVTSGVRFFDDDGGVDIDFSVFGVPEGETPPFASNFANTIINYAMVTGAGITEPVATASRARLITPLPGLTGVLPLSIARPIANDGAMLRTLFAPIPPGVFVNESFGDPAFELLLQPDAALTPVPVPESLLEDSFRLEVEAAEANSTRMTRHRARLNFSGPGTSSVPTSEAVDLPHVPAFTLVDPVHPPQIMIDDVDTLPAVTIYQLTLQPKGSKKKWVVWASAAAFPGGPPIYRFPRVKASPFNTAGEFRLTIETIEMPFDSMNPAKNLDFDHFVFTDVERLHRRTARSATESFTSTAP